VFVHLEVALSCDNSHFQSPEVSKLLFEAVLHWPSIRVRVRVRV